MIKAHKIRLNPTPAQVAYFRKAAGTARFVFNWALSRWQERRASGESVSVLALKAEFNRIKGAEFPWVYEVTKTAAEGAFMNFSCVSLARSCQQWYPIGQGGGGFRSR
jgi:transposase